ncbi:hypothetical protein ACWCOU_38060, partial [Actinomadura luteofluorescens]
MPEPEQPDRAGNPANTEPASTDPASRPENDTSFDNENITRRAPFGTAIAQGAHMTHPGPGVMPGLEPPAAPGLEGPEGRAGVARIASCTAV